MKKICTILILFLSFGSFAQLVDPLDSLKMYESDPVPIYSKDYMRKYNHFKRLILKVYPYALYASDVLYQLEADSEEIIRKRKKKSFYKSAYKGLKTDFKYVFLELFTSEGNMLMKLVHRETGMTVYDIADKYKGRKSATVFNLMGKIWDQDVKSKFDPQGEDKIAEHVIQDIESGVISLNNKVIRVGKEQYKHNRKVHKKRLRDNKKRRKQNKKDCEKDSKRKVKSPI